MKSSLQIMDQRIHHLLIIGHRSAKKQNEKGEGKACVVPKIGITPIKKAPRTSFAGLSVEFMLVLRSQPYRRTPV